MYPHRESLQQTGDSSYVPGAHRVRAPPKAICTFSVYIFLGRGTIPSTSFSKRPSATPHYPAENSLYTLKPLVLT